MAAQRNLSELGGLNGEELLVRLRQARKAFAAERKKGGDGRNCACAQFAAMIRFVSAALEPKEEGLLAPAALLLTDLANFNMGRGAGPMLTAPPAGARGRQAAPLSDRLLKQYVTAAVSVLMDDGEDEIAARTYVQRKLQRNGWQKTIATIKKWRGEITGLPLREKQTFLTLQQIWFEKAKGRESAKVFVDRFLREDLEPLIKRSGKGWKK